MYNTSYNVKQKVIALFLAFILTAVSVLLSTKEIHATITKENVQYVTENGIEYTIKTEEKANGKVITITQSNNSTKSIIDIDDEKIVSKQLIDQGNNSFEKNIIEIELNENSTNLGMDVIEEIESLDSTNKVTSSIEWNAKKIEKYKEKYWYRTGHNSSNDRDFLRIGGNGRYQLRVDNMTTNRANQCNIYKRAINSVNTKYNAFSTYIAGTGVSVTAALALLVANALYPATTLITILMGAFGTISLTAATKAVDIFFEMKGKYDLAKEQFTTIKAWGTAY